MTCNICACSNISTNRLPSSDAMEEELIELPVIQASGALFSHYLSHKNPSIATANLSDSVIKRTKQHLSELISGLTRAHTIRHVAIQQYTGFPLKLKAESRVNVTNKNTAEASIIDTGDLVLDYRLIESIIRGGVLEMSRINNKYISIKDLLSIPPNFDVNYRSERFVKEQDAALSKFDWYLSHLYSCYAYQVTYDLHNIDCDVPDISSLYINYNLLNSIYISSLLFVLSHEQGHLALGHFSRLEVLEKSVKGLPDREVNELRCKWKKKIEAEADVYALLLLDKTIDPNFVILLENNIPFLGYRNFLSNSYELAGFDKYEATCSHEDNKNRFERLYRLHKLIYDKAGVNDIRNFIINSIGEIQ
jgi:hypothetical protein